MASVRYTLDPLTLTPLRNAVIHSAWGRGKIDLPPGIAKKLGNTPVYVGSDIRESKFRKDLPKSMRVERVSDTARNQKFKVKDDRQQEQQAETGRKQDTGRATGEAKKDNGVAGKDNGVARKDNEDARRLEQQQGKDTRAQEKAVRTQTQVQNKVQRQAQGRARGERVGKPAKPEAKPQTQAAPKQQERKQKPPAAAGGKGQGGGKGKGKKP